MTVRNLLNKLSLMLFTTGFIFPSFASIDISGYFKSLTSFQANFSQTVQQDGSIAQISSGKVYLKKPMLFFWDYTSPEPIQIISDGERFYHYDIELMQATVKPVSELSSTPIALLLDDSQNLNAQFDVTAISVDDVQKSVMNFHNSAEQYYRLIPKANSTDGLPLLQVLIGFSDNKLVFLSAADELGVTTFNFSKVIENQNIDDKTFIFNPPDNVDVLGG